MTTKKLLQEAVRFLAWAIFLFVLLDISDEIVGYSRGWSYTNTKHFIDAAGLYLWWKLK